MPIEFLKRRPKAAAPVAPAPVAPVTRPGMPEEVVAQDHHLRLNFGGKTSEGVRMKAGPEALAELPAMVSPIAAGPVEVVLPRDIDSGQASPAIIRTDEARAWLDAHGGQSPVTRHALYILETIDAVDPAYETVACALLDGTTDPAGYPDYSAIIGGAAAHWDESTGDLIVRGVVGWGGRGARGDTDRQAGQLLSRIVRGIFESGFALGLTDVERRAHVPGATALVCDHCGFASLSARSMFCPKCGMRLVRA